MTISLERPVAEDPYAKLPPVASFEVVSDDLVDGSRLEDSSASSSAGGKDISPPLRWSGVPAGTKSFAVTCFDPDAPVPGGFWHWTLVDLPPSVDSLESGAGSRGASLPEGAFHVRNDAGKAGYAGCAPPEGDRDHRYYFVVHALDIEKLGVDESASPTVVAFNTVFHTIGRAIIVGTYSR